MNENKASKRTLTRRLLTYPSLLGLDVMALVVGLEEVQNLLGDETHGESNVVKVMYEFVVDLQLETYLTHIKHNNNFKHKLVNKPKSSNDN